jgi:hypothetical protein
MNNLEAQTAPSATQNAAQPQFVAEPSTGTSKVVVVMVSLLGAGLLFIVGVTAFVTYQGGKVKSTFENISPTLPE